VNEGDDLSEFSAVFQNMHPERQEAMHPCDQSEIFELMTQST
jgi:hypothetical protein